MKRSIICVIAAVAAAVYCVPASAITPDEKDYDESIRLPVRRLHPEREFDKAMKKMHKEHEAKSKEIENRGKQLEEKRKNRHDNRVVVEKRQQQPAQSTADKALMQELLSKDYSIKKYDLYEEPKPIKWKDEPVSHDVKGLMNHVNGTKRGNGLFYVPKGVSMANDANEVFFCFDGNSGSATGRLHLRVQYFADDPLYYSDIVFTIDGFDYKFHPSKPSRGKMGARMYWEQSEDALTSQHKDLVYALSHCHWVRMSLKGADGMNHVKMLTREQLDAFTRTFDLYRAMGGKF